MNQEKDLQKHVEKHIKQLSTMQVQYFSTNIKPEIYNEISSKMGELKEYLVNTF